MSKRPFHFTSLLVGFALGALVLATSWLAINGNLKKLFDFENDLYAGRTIITGQRDETRLPGFKVALLDVVKKVTGDHSLTSSDIESIVHGNIKLYVKDFTDHDRMADIPIHDEQGTRDRSFELLINFVPIKVNAMLHSLGRKPWLNHRPRVLVLVGVKNATRSYVLTGDEDEELGAEQRESFIAAAWQAGLPLVLPTSVSLKMAKLEVNSLDRISPSQQLDLARSLSADVVITGHLVWIGGANGWKADWSLQEEKAGHHWQIEGTNFDGAFRNAMRGAAQILSQHGDPPPNLN